MDRAQLEPASALRAARERAGLSQSELAKAAGTSQPAVSEIERGRRQPTVARFDLLLRACGASLAVAYDGSVQVDPHDLELLHLNRALTPAQRLSQMSRLLGLKGLARRD